MTEEAKEYICLIAPFVGSADTFPKGDSKKRSGAPAFSDREGDSLSRHTATAPPEEEPDPKGEGCRTILHCFYKILFIKAIKITIIRASDFAERREHKPGIPNA